MESHLAVLAGDGPPRGHRTLAEKAFQTLHAAIIDGSLRPGARLPIEGLAEHLRMSPMPIREALRRLDAAGLVDHIPHRGARVTDLSVIDLAEVYEVRLALELLAIRRATARFTRTDEQAMRGALETLDKMSDDSSTATTAAHEAFHFALYRAAGSAWLLRLIRPVWETSERYCLEVPECRQLVARKSEHVAIVDACAVRDPERAVAALWRHLTTTANSIATAMGARALYDPEKPPAG
jgi:DNA-binding GntR family transcriptional regulator